MADIDAQAATGARASASTTCTRFVIRAGARTGSTMLVRALNSDPRVRCFGEVFNSEVDFVPFEVEGYDNFSARDRELRDADFAAFLRERIFCPPPEGIEAVGYKMLYGQNWRFPGLIEHLIDDTDLHVLHLRRRNLLRSVVSWKIAESTGVWVEGGPPAGGLTRRNALQAARHPLRAVAALGRRARLMISPPRARRRVVVSVQECRDMFGLIRAHEKRVDELFHAHPKLTIFYEDLVQRPQEVFAHVQSFLGLEPRPLAVTSRRQNPEPLRELVANYAELLEAFRDTPYAWLFEE